MLLEKRSNKVINNNLTCLEIWQLVKGGFNINVR
jgi:hypothetical protein